MIAITFIFLYVQIVVRSLITQTEQISFQKSEFKGYYKAFLKGPQIDFKKVRN